MTVQEIRTAISSELAATPEYYDFKVQAIERVQNIWRMTIQPGAVHADGRHTRVVLDDSFDGAAAWWACPPKGGASVLTVISEDDQIILKDATAHPPGAGQLIRLYPPRYLQALAECWQDNAWATGAFACLEDLGAPSTFPVNPLSGHKFRWLRRAQRQALKLLGNTSSFLWGPPGTGKTTVLGVIVAEYLHVNPRGRVLLLSTTNHAVDQATVAVDKALEFSNRRLLRDTVKRIGSRFIASEYHGREHLLPVLDRELIARLARAEGERPSPKEIEDYSAWAEKVEKLRKKVQTQSLNVLRSARLASMTTTRAAFTLADLRELPPFDLLVFDEASQVGLAHALMLMPLGRSRLFAGDPAQLAPVVRSQSKHAQRWLARSPFDLKPNSGPSICILDEQSRMAEPICSIVSQLFYGGSLRVASHIENIDTWRAERQVVVGDIAADQHISLQPVSESGTWSQHYQGPIRYQSAELIAELLSSALDTLSTKPGSVVVLTPFRAQRALLRQRLSAHGVKRVKVSTVHRAQGSEAAIVLFDPVDGSNPFLLTEDARRLINVALSRAQAKIILFLSETDCANPLFGQISNITRLASDSRVAIPLTDLVWEVGFPRIAIGRRVTVGGYVGEVSRAASDNSKLWIINELTGGEHCFQVSILRDKTKSRTV
ncbi:DEAD/DEAH box helicase [uncultured Thiodictyon sp.]|uniref:DEAD/DEAH box helicase n=1 Tax=uncultured Thiodictyon sp. TaxID=1846217 RepID=UPI0025F29A2F|nr:DEAD/DEAH box helicase [uncultured Thiodictyon sp.]